MAAKVRHDDTRAQRFAAWGMFGCAVLVAVVTFVLSFHGLDYYGRHVAGLGGLSVLVPLGVDGLTLVAIAATFLLAGVAFKVRLYAWAVFAVANAASVAGNLSHAHARHLSWDGAAGAAAWPILLTLASHLAIVTRRHLMHSDSDTGSDTAATSPAPEPVAAGVAPAVALEKMPATCVAPPPAPVPAPASVSQPTARRTQTARRTMSDEQISARRRVRSGESCATIALALGVSKKTVERWTADVRAQRQATAGETTTEPADAEPERELAGVR